MFRQSICVAMIAMLLLSLVTGCSPAPAPSKETPSTSRQGGIDPCTLLSADEVTAAAGQPFKPGIREGNSCSFESAEVSAKYSTLLLTVIPDGANAFERTRQIREKNSKNTPVRDLPGVGDAAFVTGKDMDVLKKGIWLSFRPIGKAFTTQNGEMLGKQAAARLP